MCGAVTITGCGPAVRLLGVSSLNLGRTEMCGPIFLDQGNKLAVLIKMVGRVEIGQDSNLPVDRRKIGACRVEQLLEIVDHEIELLKIVDTITGSHDPAQIEPEPAGSRVFETVD